MVQECSNRDNPRKADAGLTTGKLSVTMDRGSLRIFWRGNELTREDGGRTRIADDRHEVFSPDIPWTVETIDAGSFRAQGEWTRWGIQEQWKVSLVSENEFKWQVWLDVPHDCCLQAVSAGLVLSGEYTHAKAEKVPVALHDGDWLHETTFWASRRPTNSIYIANYRSSGNDSGTPGVILALEPTAQFVELSIGNGPRYDDGNTRKIEVLRFRSEIVPMRLKHGRYSILDARIIVGKERVLPLNQPLDTFSNGYLAKILLLNRTSYSHMTACRRIIEKRLPLIMKNGYVSRPTVKFVAPASEELTQEEKDIFTGVNAEDLIARKPGFLGQLGLLMRLRREKFDLVVTTVTDVAVGRTMKDKFSVAIIKPRTDLMFDYAFRNIFYGGSSVGRLLRKVKGLVRRGVGLVLRNIARFTGYGAVLLYLFPAILVIKARGGRENQP
ncbi:hypothetical protein ACFL1X_01700 [Candidatus Hydrogenedentota bacterium]